MRGAFRCDNVTCVTPGVHRTRPLLRPVNALRSAALLPTTAKYVGFALQALRRHGWRHTLADLAAEFWFDLRRGTETFLPHELDRLRVTAPAVTDGVQYQAANPRLVRELLSWIPASAHAATFVDYGCGKGRVLMLAAETGFTRLLGVEFAPELAAVCEVNLRRRQGSVAQTDVKVRVQDAAEFEPPPGPLVVFLYNPFHGETLRRVVARLRHRAKADRQPVWILYANPRELPAFTAAGFVVTKAASRRGLTLGVLLR
jgi:SAM-dependent methyltransferase